MGTDIHMMVEHKEKGEWTFYPMEVDIGRDYLLFGILANVRPPNTVYISTPRGLPSDIDPKTFHEFIGANDKKSFDLYYHSASWLLIPELLDFFNASSVKWKKKEKQRKERRDLVEDINLDWLWSIFRENIDHDLNNIRVVFCFDS